MFHRSLPTQSHLLKKHSTHSELFGTGLVSLMSLMSLLASLAAQAAPVMTSKDWTLDLEPGATPQSQVCRAYVKSQIVQPGAPQSPINLQLELVMLGSLNGGVAPLEIRVRPIDSTDLLSGVVSLDRAKTQNYRFSRVADAALQQDVLWHVPKNSESFVNYLKREMRVDMLLKDTQGQDRPVIFSLRGSSAAITELQKRCSPAGLVAANFEREFIGARADFDPSRLTPALTADLRKAYAEAYRAHLSQLQAGDQLKALNARYMRELNELTGLRRNLDRLTTQEMQRLTRARDAAELAIRTADQELIGLRSQVGQEETQLAQHNANYEAAYNILKPHTAEHRRLSQDVSSAHEQMRISEERLRQIDSELAEAEARYQQADRELQALRSDLSRAEDSVRLARRELSQAQSDLSAFDVQGETQRRIRSDSRLDDIERQLRGMGQRIQAQRQAVDRAEQERNEANQALGQCRQTAGADCSAQQTALTDAQRRFHEARQALEQLERNQDQLQAERQNRVEQIRRDVDQQRQQLLAREQEARRRVDQAEEQVSRIESRARDLAQFEMPRLQSQISTLRSERPTVESQVRRSRQDLNAAQTALQQFKLAVDYDRKAAAVDEQARLVNASKARLAQIDQGIRSREQLIRQKQAELTQISSDTQKVIETIRLKEARSLEVQQALQPYEAEKQRLEAQQQAELAQFNTARDQFALILN